MKKVLLISAMILSAFSYQAKSQVSLGVNIGQQPEWGPVGYDYANYYYLPDLGVYYDVPRCLFVYFDFGRWNFAAVLPGRFGHFDLFHCYKVVVNDRNPWLRNDYYRNYYDSYRGRLQPVIRDNRDNRYFASRAGYDRDRHFETRQGFRDDHRGTFGRDNVHGDRGGDRGDRGRDRGDRGRDRGDRHGRGDRYRR